MTTTGTEPRNAAEARARSKRRDFVRFSALPAVLLTVLRAASAAPPADAGFPDLEERGLVGVAQQLLDLKTIGRVLNLAAHPDDEDGATLAFARHGQGLRTFTAFANRGEGGQNEIGPELYRELGAIREIETRRAQAHVGSHPLFLGLEDFGYCKTAEEAFARWGGEDLVTERVVYVYRTVRPDVVFTNHDPLTGHGQHRALSIAGRRAFEISGDPDAFPEQGLAPWAPTLYLERVAAPSPPTTDLANPTGGSAESATTIGAAANAPGANDRGADATPAPPPDERPRFIVDIDAIDPVRGTSFAEQAHAALKEHHSQGRWEGRRRGSRWFAEQARRHRAFLPPHADPFDPIALNRLRAFRAGAEDHVDDEVLTRIIHPAFFRPELAPPSERDALFDALLLHRKALATAITEVAPYKSHLGEDLRGLLSIANQTLAELMNVRARIVTEPSPPIAGEEAQVFLAIQAPPSVEVTPDGKPDADGAVRVPLAPQTFADPGAPLAFSPLYSALDPDERNAIEASHVLRDPRTGRAVPVRAHASLTPESPVTLEFSPRIRVLRADMQRRSEDGAQTTAQAILRVLLAQPITEALDLEIFDDLGVSRGTVTVPAESKGTVLLPISLQVPDKEGTSIFRVRAARDARPVFALTPWKVVVVEATVAEGLRVGVVRSYDDTLEGALADLSVQARPLTTDDLAFRDLSGFDAILIDIRAFLVREDLIRFHPRLLDYARAGGVLAIFYQKTGEWNPKQNGGNVFAPFPLEITRARVVDEAAPVELLRKDHPLLSWPNRMRPTDFDDWVHERGLYFPNQSYDPAYAELLSCHDADEEPLRGGLLHAPVGDGHFVYTAYGWYRQWLAGQPGAYRFLGNLVSLGRSEQP